MSFDDDAQHNAADPGSARARLGGDFLPRIVSGVVIAALAAICLFSGVTPFAVLVVAVAMLLSWEWARLVHGGDATLVVVVHIAAAAVAAVLAAAGYVGLGLLTLPIGAILATLLSLGRNSMFAGLGVLYAGLPAIALIWLRSDTRLGILAVAFLIVVVVASDTGGFLAGRLLGGAKLWPRVSPNKTWSGALGSLISSAVVGALFWLTVPNSSPLWLALAGAVLSVVAQAGDLAESAIKRRFGAKDTSALIPGHGGVMDRVDGLVAAATAVGLAGLIINVHSPAHALLLGS
jgi:phosphatidate cytidylyltransferase